jgi:hypothetical protein
VNDLLNGGELTDDWKGGLVRLLAKREPASQLENLRPVTLLNTIYKLFSGIVNYRLQRAMETRGVIEEAQVFGQGIRPEALWRKCNT